MIELLHTDCMEYMKGLKDNAFDLAIVDPPYGIRINKQHLGNDWYKEKKKWDEQKPDNNYFNELFRVSVKQIIWGGKYFYLPKTSGWIQWNKKPFLKGLAKQEFAWTSFLEMEHKFEYTYCGNCEGYEGKLKVDYKAKRIHVTQKPIALYLWILKNFSSIGDKILDTHLGSGSSAIAAHSMGFDFVGCELDKDYYEAACKRFKEQTAQQKLFQ